jgi:hypothetical protein
VTPIQIYNEEDHTEHSV